MDPTEELIQLLAEIAAEQAMRKVADPDTAADAVEGFADAADSLLDLF